MKMIEIVAKATLRSFSCENEVSVECSRSQQIESNFGLRGRRTERTYWDAQISAYREMRIVNNGWQELQPIEKPNLLRSAAIEPNFVLRRESIQRGFGHCFSDFRHRASLASISLDLVTIRSFNGLPAEYERVDQTEHRAFGLSGRKAAKSQIKKHKSQISLWLQTKRGCFEIPTGQLPNPSSSSISHARGLRRAFGNELQLQPLTSNGVFGIWDLRFCWDLEVGIWDLASEASEASATTLGSSSALPPHASAWGMSAPSGTHLQPTVYSLQPEQECTPFGKTTRYTGTGPDLQWNTLDDAVAPFSRIYNNYIFQARRLDQESGLYYFRTRHYSPAEGRFIQRDKPGDWYDPMNAGNGYNFVGSNSFNFAEATILLCIFSDLNDWVKTINDSISSWIDDFVKRFKEGVEKAPKKEDPNDKYRREAEEAKKKRAERLKQIEERQKWITECIDRNNKMIAELVKRHTNLEGFFDTEINAIKAQNEGLQEEYASLAGEHARLEEENRRGQ